MNLESISYIIDTLYAIFAMTLIIFMVPGFAMLEAGIVRTKNVTAVLTINTLIYAVASLSFLLFGYSLAFGDLGSDSMTGMEVAIELKMPVFFASINTADYVEDIEHLKRDSEVWTR